MDLFAEALRIVLGISFRCPAFLFYKHKIEREYLQPMSPKGYFHFSHVAALQPLPPFAESAWLIPKAASAHVGKSAQRFIRRPTFQWHEVKREGQSTPWLDPALPLLLRTATHRTCSFRLCSPLPDTNSQYKYAFRGKRAAKKVIPSASRRRISQASYASASPCPCRRSPAGHCPRPSHSLHYRTELGCRISG